jgi:hypothetical protein
VQPSNWGALLTIPITAPISWEINHEKKTATFKLAALI